MKKIGNDVEVRPDGFTVTPPATALEGEPTLVFEGDLESDDDSEDDAEDSEGESDDQEETDMDTD